MRKVVITGATSMLGIALIKECIINDVYVLAIAHKGSNNLSRIPASPLVNTIECNLENLKSLEFEKKQDYEIFYHFAWAETSNLSRDNISKHIDNIEYTIDAVKLASKLGCNTFVGAGSQAEYGRVNHIISSETPCNPENAYGIAKYAAGKFSKIACNNMGIKYVWGRIFSVYGPNNNRETMLMYAISELLAGRKPALTKCEQIWDFLFCEDAARALYLLGEKGVNNMIYCIGSGEGKPLLNYIEIIRDLINPKLPLGIGSKEYCENQVMNLCADIKELKRDSGFIQITSFEEGIKATIEWLKTNSIY